MKVLLVEDDANDAELLQSLLKRQAKDGIELVHVVRLSEALDSLHQNTPDVVLLDLNLPDSNGLDSVQHIQYASPEVPIVVLSGFDSEEFAIEILNHGVQDYLVKWEGNGRTILRSIRYAIERKRTDLRLYQLAHYDRLTGLSNRQYFNEQLDRAVARARRNNRRVALFFVDLDNFKIVNDTLGHHAGDQVLVQTAHRLQQHVRAGDTVARLGGDEFAVLIEDVESTLDIEAMGHNLLQTLAEPADIDGRPITVTGSIGIALFPSDTNDVNALLKNADIAMYQAKESGRNDVRFFTEKMHSRLLQYHQTESEIRDAIQNQQFHLEFQPKLGLQDLNLHGLEALLRWNHPVRGVISPTEFIPVAEASGQIVPLGYWVIEQACRHIQAWRNFGIDVPQISVNVSALQFSQADFHERIREILEKTGAPPELIQLELTEGILMEDSDSIQVCLQRLKDIGLQLAIDDFGTGYSCLSYLRKFPIDVVKIDKSFVSDIGRHKDGEAICAAIISMAKRLNLEIVAEGIETDEQLRFLIDSGCRIGQGFIFSKPVTADRLSHLFPGDCKVSSTFGDTTRVRLLQGVS